MHYLNTKNMPIQVNATCGIKFASLISLRTILIFPGETCMMLATEGYLRCTCTDVLSGLIPISISLIKTVNGPLVPMGYCLILEVIAWDSTSPPEGGAMLNSENYTHIT